MGWGRRGGFFRDGGRGAVVSGLVEGFCQAVVLWPGRGSVGFGRATAVFVSSSTRERIEPKRRSGGWVLNRTGPMGLMGPMRPKALRLMKPKSHRSHSCLVPALPATPSDDQSAVLKRFHRCRNPNLVQKKAGNMEAKTQNNTQLSAVGTGRRRRKDPAENLLAYLTQDTGGELNVLGYAVGSFLSFFGAVMTTFVSIQPEPRYLWLGFCLVTAAISLILMISALSKPAVGE